MSTSLKILTVAALLSLLAFVGSTRAEPTGEPPSGVAIAQIKQCLSISKATDRLACYDRANSPAAAGKPAISKFKTAAAPRKPAAPKTPLKFADMLAAENSKLNAKLRTICRGC
jgi:hypothetical protein